MQCISCQQEEANKESGLCNQCERVDEKKINGLLYLPAAGLMINHHDAYWSMELLCGDVPLFPVRGN